MSTFLTAKSLTLSFTSTALFKSLNVTINRGDKVGLIGHNGCGKSSLLKLLSGQIEPSEGHIAKAKQCLMSYVEQHLPEPLHSRTVLAALTETLSDDGHWRAEMLLSELGFLESDWQMAMKNCSGGQQMRLLLARAIINEPDLLLLDEPSNHLDLPSLMWLEQFLSHWKGTFVLVSHDQTLLDSVTNTTWVMRDQSLYHFALPCSQARQALKEKDAQDQARHNSEQKEIDRIEKSAKRLAVWGKVYDNEDLARKAKTMFARKERLEEQQTELSEGAPWCLELHGEALPANRLLEVSALAVKPAPNYPALFEMPDMRIKSGDRIAVLGRNGCGKSTLLNLCHRFYLQQEAGQAALLEHQDDSVIFHDRCRLGYYDQSLAQLADQDTLTDALGHFAAISNEQSKRALISAGFEYARHTQKIESLSGGERARLLFVGLTLARYHLLFLDEPTNHLDMEGKEELIETLNAFEGAAVLVSHDRSLIEQSCNRFWLIQQGRLSEYLSAEEVYLQLSEHAEYSAQHAKPIEKGTALHADHEDTEEEQLLERLLHLESLLAADRQRKPKHQKPDLQKQWQEEIEKISNQL
ncbi:ABC-F family ATP-binding cassette domain-containing protein [Celerinatantimonas diazotrophica]|uniref:ATPase subunit of ABC transporter with duplicated ATPase domains n=1 Tax=Celerinatantimonas diazotrophica TaxID=412034 RepID=A0A4R1K3T9_9GAMM|nr:ABC-F family ATP-binding cassette domain-containing protein [Celerinatantimonas diazotrophica]TCK58570.1 ATPase subunit of ABC transporter with duplicated ATPase domains [Celerinatantimonas diazotrophica]CAG9297199.1 putative ABC transporter ATP-binding protein YheS [Celerinatantimonas diazotrophica]